ncbi:MULTISPECIES: hypothetical protein [Bacillaceae]|uniref:Uncharacterized protein n=2 Tax=Bacillaceae TaxID=186817 RepID=A0A9D5DTJ8_9BACI|nr:MULTISPECIES: hypothetical protein [Bacillaceae]KQL56422.1 hypothetical protein AN965_13975 [Alkalicoccobacillus plakortidis]MBG9782669.1 hypothetical protein [Shouchella lehensis]RQW21872.1 hypothetical protein EH196_04995 [Bacillus sp. C1-1]TES47714.1 hypothetical protein E2L03_11145 [Shouchella lehensis]
MTTNQKKERPSLVMMIYMWIFILVALVNLVGIASQNLYQSIFPFFIVSLLNIVLAALLILHALKTSDSRERRLAIIYLIGIGFIAAVTFFRYLFMQA